MNTLRIRTPEGVTFALPLAGPVSRLLAWLVDAFLVMAGASLLTVGLSLLGLVLNDLATALLLLAWFLAPLAYTGFFEWRWRGQTPGKRAFRLRVVDAEGLRLAPGQILLRNLLRAVDILPGLYLVGGVACLLSRRHQRLGDLAANTVVVRLPRLADPDLTPVLAGRFNSLRPYPHLAARLRQRTPATVADLALQALLRRDELAPEARVTLFADLAEHFRRAVEFPSEATDGLADEQYVRNVVDLLYRPR
jgi:uncharacterized RDD family membrane protein YckC